MSNLSELYMHQGTYVEDLKVGDYVTILSIKENIRGSVPWNIGDVCEVVSIRTPKERMIDQRMYEYDSTVSCNSCTTFHHTIKVKGLIKRDYINGQYQEVKPYLDSRFTCDCILGDCIGRPLRSKG